MQVESLESRRLFAAGFASGPSVIVPLIGSPLRAEVEPRQLLTGSDASTYTVIYGAGVGTQIRRVTPAGRLDSAFGRKGRLTFAADGVKVALDGYDRLYVLVGRQVTRFSAAGQIDKSYTGDGTTTLGIFTKVNDILVDRQDRLWAVGTRSVTINTEYGNTSQSYDVSGFTVARVNSRGIYDTKFDSDGIYADELTGTSVRDRRSIGVKLRLLGDDSVIATGIGSYDTPTETEPPSDTVNFVESVKFNANGKRDLSYGRRGRAFFYQDSDNGTAGVNVYGILPNGATVVKQTITSNSTPATFVRQITPAGKASNQTPAGTFPDAIDTPVTTDRADGYVVTASITPPASDLGDSGPSGSITLTAQTTHTLPRATATGRNIRTAASSVRFDVFYSGVDVLRGSIDGDEILVKNAAGQYRDARLFSVIEQSDGRFRAEYRAGNPDGSDGFTRDDNGPLTIIARAGGATDSDGNGNVAATIGNVNLKIA